MESKHKIQENVDSGIEEWDEKLSRRFYFICNYLLKHTYMLFAVFEIFNNRKYVPYLS